MAGSITLCDVQKDRGGTLVLVFTCTCVECVCIFKIEAILFSCVVQVGKIVERCGGWVLFKKPTLEKS